MSEKIFLRIQTSDKSIIHKHLDDAMDNTELSIISLKKIELSGHYFLEIVRNDNQNDDISII